MLLIRLFYLLSMHFVTIELIMAQEIPLYSGSIPNSIKAANEEYADSSRGILIVHKVSVPTLTIFLPSKEKSTGAAVVICPGGGYGILAAGHEGFDVAKKLNELGVAAFVLKYRIPDNKVMIEKELGPLQDAQKALEMVRKNARKWNVDPKRVGIMGFSAGGHLAATVGTNPSLVAGRRIKKTARPDFMILIYPVISFTDSVGHIGSRNQLLGKNPPHPKVILFSNELQVTDKTPPAFLVHAKDDDGVSYKNSMLYHKALQQHGISTDIYLFEKGGHGFGMNNPLSAVQWMDKLMDWLKKNDWLKM